MLFEINHVKKQFGDRLLFSIDQLRIGKGDRIGLIGRNGTGKTTLLDIIAGIQNADEGEITTQATIATIPQIQQDDRSQSGGEMTKASIQEAFAKAPDILLADEPTSNLDIESVKQLEQKFLRFRGAMVIISHDRSFLDAICNKIWEVENQTVTAFSGNYQTYSTWKKQQKKRQIEEYEQYQKKKKQLEHAILLKKQKAEKMIKPPSKRMGTSESKLWKVNKGVQQKAVHQTIDALKTRIDKMEAIEKPKEIPVVKMNLPSESILTNKTVIQAKEISATIDGKTLWKDASFTIRTGAKTAIIGANGAGKTTLIKRFLQNHLEGIQISVGVKMGYFSQQIDILDPAKSILENVQAIAVQPTDMVRIVLARLLFTGDDVYKRVEVLSGGEQVKVAFAKIFLSDMNVLVMDEPTNFLDMESIHALEQLLSHYEGTVIFVSHDRRFIQNLADHILEIKNSKITSYTGSMKAYQAKQQNSSKPNEEELLLLETKLTEILSRLSIEPSAELEKEFTTILQRRKELNQQKKGAR
jgi:pleuromutilin/lincosamide/streptogramin A transport system ATP-binding/permease protein